MKLKIYHWYDSKTESWSLPYFRLNRGEANRMFEDMVNTKEQGNNVEKYPSDFTWFECGEYDLQTGLYSLYESKINMGLAIEFKKTADSVPQN
ncbi:MAG: nonstructural protein [Arizlama microvirus]|nr:MAG: nonstructural protein [Arizlama microvirus]